MSAETSERQHRHDQIVQLARDAYAEHRLVRAAEGRWLIKQEHDGDYWAEVATLTGNRLVLVGDGPDLIFWGGGCTGEEQVRWAASVSLDYLAGRVLPHSNARAWNHAVAIDELEARIRENDADLNENGDVYEYAVARHRAWLGALDACRNAGSQDEFLRAFMEAVHDEPDAWEYSFGDVVDSDVYYAHAAFKRLVTLLDEAAQEAGR